MMDEWNIHLIRYDKWMGCMPKVDAHHSYDICHMPSNEVYKDKMDGMAGWHTRSECTSFI
jgi:hypothetical protein